MGNRFAALDLVKAFADGGQKFDSLGDDIQAGVFRQTLDRIQSQLLVAHVKKITLDSCCRKREAEKFRDLRRVDELAIAFAQEKCEWEMKHEKKIAKRKWSDTICELQI